jgi:hypothetical protein
MHARTVSIVKTVACGWSGTMLPFGAHASLRMDTTYRSQLHGSNAGASGGSGSAESSRQRAGILAGGDGWLRLVVEATSQEYVGHTIAWRVRRAERNDANCA